MTAAEYERRQLIARLLFCFSLPPPIQSVFCLMLILNMYAPPLSRVSSCNMYVICIIGLFELVLKLVLNSYTLKNDKHFVCL